MRRGDIDPHARPSIDPHARPSRPINDGGRARVCARTSHSPPARIPCRIPKRQGRRLHPGAVRHVPAHGEAFGSGGVAGYGYCASNSRFYRGLKLSTVCTTIGVRLAWNSGPSAARGPTLLGNPRGNLSARGESELGQNALDVSLCGSLGDDQAVGYGLVCQALGNQLGDFAFTFGQSGRGSWARGESPRHVRRLRLLREDEVCEFEEVPAGVA